MSSIIEKILKGFLGDKNKKDVKELQKYADRALEAEKTIETLSDDELRAKLLNSKRNWPKQLNLKCKRSKS